jgi:hypothetical protein
MKKEQNGDTGIKFLIKIYKEKFKIPENLNYYSAEDYKKAEKKFLKYTLFEGKL